MKTTFIVPKDDDRSCPLSQAGFGRVLPPVGLAPMAGLVGRHGAVDLVDERIASARHTFSSDIAVFFINSYNRQRCFELAKLYRQSGSYVVFSGPLLSRDIMEPSNYADSLLQGFGEDYMAEFLSDYKKGKAKCFYRKDGKEQPQMLFKTAGGYAAYGLA